MKEFEGWTRNTEGDQPRLVSQCDSQKDRAIPAQFGFITPDGAEVQMSYTRALELGLVEPQIIPTERMDEWGKRRLE